MRHEEYYNALHACRDRKNWGPELYKKVQSIVYAEWQQLFRPGASI